MLKLLNYFKILHLYAFIVFILRPLRGHQGTHMISLLESAGFQATGKNCSICWIIPIAFPLLAHKETKLIVFPIYHWHHQMDKC